MDLGQARRGVDMGPGALRYAGLDNRLRDLVFAVTDTGNVKVPIRDELPAQGGMEFLPAVLTAARRAREAGLEALAAGSLPLFLGGDHSIALGTVAAAVSSGQIGVLWIDAHGDFNTPETSPSGNLHGMPLAALTGRGATEMTDIFGEGPTLADRDVVVLGLRSLDPGERDLLRSSDVGVFTMREIDEQGIGRVAQQALQRLAHCQALHVSLDMDALDPQEAGGVGTPVPGGLTYREAHLLMETLASADRVASVDVVEINPILDERNRTARIAVDLIASLLGQSIL
jgi:arginase